MLAQVAIPAALQKRVRIASFELHEGINVLAGPNGSGKSTILRGIREGQIPVNTREMGLVYFDTETMNPRVGSQVSTMLDIAVRWKSHGESALPILIDGAKQNMRKAKGDLSVFVDEPEAALDHDALTRYRRFLMATRRRKVPVHFLIATHSPRLWTIPGANLIELAPGYVERVLADLRKELGT